LIAGLPIVLRDPLPPDAPSESERVIGSTPKPTTREHVSPIDMPELRRISRRSSIALPQRTGTARASPSNEPVSRWFTDLGDE